ncbi:MAG: sugar kinase [Pseudomonadota bacterium]
MTSRSKRTLLGIGECMVELAPAERGLFEVGFAGDVLNTLWYAQAAFSGAAGAAWQTGFFSQVGQDDLSNQMMDFIEAGGVDCNFVQRSNRRPGLYMIHLNAGERSFSYWRGESAARHMLNEPSLLDKALNASGAVYLSGITLAILSPAHRAILLDRLAIARQQGTIVAFDPNIRPSLWETEQTMRETIMAGAAVSTLVLPSFDDEAAAFGDTNPEATANRYAASDGHTIIVKNGGGAVTVKASGSGDSVLEIETPPVGNIIDTTAAGDAFNGACLAVHLKGEDIETAVRTGQACAANVIQHRGALIPRTR